MNDSHQSRRMRHQDARKRLDFSSRSSELWSPILSAGRSFFIDHSHRQFNIFFVIFSFIFLLAILLLFLFLRNADRLPSLPITGTNCIDEKFLFLHERDFSNADLIAVGSSATWRNLSMQAFIAKETAVDPINTAPCFLFVNQTAYLTSFLLDHMPSVTTVLTVIAPRDFEECHGADTEFFDPGHARSYIFEKNYPWYLYITNIDLRRFIQDSMRLHKMRGDPQSRFSVAMSERGGGPMLVPNPKFYPEPNINQQCFAWLSQLEKTSVDHGARLVVVTFPTVERWQKLFDPEGKVMADFKASVRSALNHPTTIIVDGDDFPAEESYFADGVHFLWPYTRPFSLFIAERINDAS